MANLLEIVVRVRDATSNVVEGITSKFQSLRSGLNELAKNRLLQGIGFAAILKTLRDAWAEADKFEGSLRKLDATAKLTGVPLYQLQAIADEGRQKFGLSTMMANDYAVELAKLAGKAGDVSKAAQGMAAFLEIGAARGLTAGETLKAVQQAILGIDEGTDKLFNKNPSVLYKEYADQIGISVGKLTDQQKAQALLNAALEDGLVVQGSYADFMKSSAGTQEASNNRIQEAKVRIGQATAGIRDELMPALATLMEWGATALPYVLLPFQGLWQIVETLAHGAVSFFSAIYQSAAAMVGGLLEIMGTAGTTMKGLLRKLGVDVGDGMAEQWKAAGRRIRTEATGELVAGWKADNARMKEIWLGTTDEIEKGEKASLGRRTGNVRTNTGEVTEEAKKRQKALEAIDKLGNESALSLLNEQHRAYLELTAKFHDKMKDLRGQDLADAQAKLTQAQQNLLIKWAGFNQELTPKITHGTTLIVDNTKLQGMALGNLGGDLDRFNEKTGRYTSAQIDAARKSKEWRDELVNVSDEIVGAAFKVQELAQNLEPLFGSAFVSQINQAVGAISDMGAAVGQIASGNILGGITQGVGALVSLGKTIFGSSDGMGKALKENSGRLRELRGTMGDLIDVQQSGREITGIQTALQRALPRLSGKLGSDEKRILDAELLRVGLDRQALNDMAETLGIRIRDDNGELQADLLRQLLRAIGLLDTEWAAGYRGQRERIAQGVSIGAIGDELGEAVRLLTDPTTGSGAISRALSGFDLSSAGGRSGAIGALQNLFANIGSVSVADLGGLSRSEFTDALQWLVELLSATTEVAAETGGTSDAPVPVPTEERPAGETVVQADDVEAVIAAVPDYVTILERGLAVQIGSQDLLARIADSLSPSAEGGHALGPVIHVDRLEIVVPLSAEAAGGDRRALAEDIRREIVSVLDEDLASVYRRQQAMTGNVVRA